MGSGSDKYLKLIKKIVLENIPKDKFLVFLFGSRTLNKHRFGADVDIGIKGNKELNQDIIYKIKEKIEESIVPFKVDIIDFSKVDESFKTEAFKNVEIWNQANSINLD